MIVQATEQQSVYLSEFAEFSKTVEGDGGSWVHPLRRDAISSFAELGFPTTHIEDWKFTNVAPIARVLFGLAEERPEPVLPDNLERFALAANDCYRLVFVNGRYRGDLSSRGSLQRGVKIATLSAALAVNHEALSGNLAHYADYRKHPFVALNTAFLRDGAFLQVPDGTVVERPIQFVYLTTPGEQPWVTHPRNLILAGAGSQFTVIEAYIGGGKGVYFTNAVTEISAGENSVIQHYKLQLESNEAFHMGTVQVEQGRDVNFSSQFLSLGGALVRNETNAVLSQGSEATLDGLYLTAGTGHVDNQIFLDHAKPHTTSHELYKGILDGHSSAVFNGKILVRPDAQKTDAKQSNKNLVLSEDAVINTKPQLQIYADDVRCTHGATIGQIDSEAVFYLRSRGIGLEDARKLLVVAFAQDIIDRIEVGSVRSALENLIIERLSRKEAA